MMRRIQLATLIIFSMVMSEAHAGDRFRLFRRSQPQCTRVCCPPTPVTNTSCCNTVVCTAQANDINEVCKACEQGDIRPYCCSQYDPRGYCSKEQLTNCMEACKGLDPDKAKLCEAACKANACYCENCRECGKGQGYDCKECSPFAQLYLDNKLSCADQHFNCYQACGTNQICRTACDVQRKLCEALQNGGN